MTAKAYAVTSGMIFVLVAVAHLVRAVAQWDVIIDDWSAPTWISLVATAVAGFLGFSGLRLGLGGRQSAGGS
jgi:hypothetical protein